MQRKTLRSLADDPDIAGPVGLAVVVIADTERVHNEIFGEPLRALARTLHFRPKPNHEVLVGRVQFDQAMLKSILSDLRAATMEYHPSVALDSTCNFVDALTYGIERLIRLLRSFGNIEKLSFSEGGTVMAEYKQSMKYVHSHRDLLAHWAPCRADERSITRYFLRVVASDGFEQRLWDVVDPEIAEMMRRFSGT